MTRKWLFFWLVCVSVFICFTPCLYNGLLIFDDTGYIIDNANIRSLSFDTVRWAFSEFYLNYWAPLTWLSLAVDYAFWGINPVGYHLTNIILHSLNAGIFYLCSSELLIYFNRDGKTDHFGTSDKGAQLWAVPVALIYAVHPLRVESVSWAVERKDVLSLFFGCAAVLMYLYHIRAISTRQQKVRSDGTPALFTISYGVSLGMFVLSLCSKSLMITLPAVLLILDWYPLKRLTREGIRRVCLEKVPFLIMAGLVSVITMKAKTLEIAGHSQVDGFTQLLNASRSISAYLFLTVWPLNVSPFYVHPGTIPTLTSEYALALTVVIVISICCFALAKQKPLFLAVWLIYLILLLPFLGFPQVGPQAMAGRFTYAAGQPLALLTVIGIMSVRRAYARSRVVFACVALFMVMVLSMNCYLTVRDISYWKDDVSLWTRVINLYPNTGRAYYQRFLAYRKNGEVQHAQSDINTAIAIATRKNYNAMHELYRARAILLSESGDFSGAVADYSRALQTAQGQARTMILYNRGVAYSKSGNTELADEDFRMAGVSGGRN